MLKEKFEKCKEYVMEHKTEILIGAGMLVVTAVVGTVIGVKCKNLSTKLQTIGDIAEGSLERELSRNRHEQTALVESIERLDKNAPINIYNKIPKREARIAELIIQEKDILKDIAICNG